MNKKIHLLLGLIAFIGMINLASANQSLSDKCATITQLLSDLDSVEGQDADKMEQLDALVYSFSPVDIAVARSYMNEEDFGYINAIWSMHVFSMTIEQLQKAAEPIR